MSRPVRVLVADDSPTMRATLVSLLTEEGDIEVVGQARDGVEARELARQLLPDVITLDIQMPRLSGLEAVRIIMAESPCRVLVVCSVSRDDEVEMAFRAVAAGALELIGKPASEGATDLRRWGQRLREATRLMSEIPVVGRRHSFHGLDGDTGPAGRCGVVAIAASTGGPPVVARLLASLPADLPVPILLAQHIGPGFARGLARWLSEVGSLPVSCLDHAARLAPAHVYLPADGHDLHLPDRASVDVTPCSGPHRPSGDRLLESVARVAGARGLGVVLTGMGDDGARGLLAIRRAGGATLAQDRASCVVWGMPAAAERAGAVERTVAVDALGAAIVELCRHRVPRSRRASS